MKKATFKLIIFALSAISSLIILEGVIRYFKLAPAIFDYKIFEPMEFVADPEVCYKMKPFGKCEGGRLNSDGFKDREFVLEKGGGVIRIAMLGDSITKGTGIPLGATFSDQLEDLLNERSERNNSGLKYEVMNFGVGGYNIVSEIGVLKAYALRYHPDIVVLNYFYNDNEAYSFNYYFFMKKKDSSPLEKNLIYDYYLSSNRFRLNRVLFRSHFYLFFLTRLKSLFKESPGMEHQYANYKEDIVSEKIKELKTLGERHHFKALIVMHPVLDYDKAMPHPNYGATGESALTYCIPCIDLRKFYQRESGDPLVFLQDRQDPVHPNIRGHRLIAGVLCEALEQDGFLR